MALFFVLQTLSLSDTQFFLFYSMNFNACRINLHVLCLKMWIQAPYRHSYIVTSRLVFYALILAMLE